MTDGLLKAIDETIAKHASQVLSMSPTLLLLYFANRNDEPLCNDLWDSLLTSVSQEPETAQTDLGSLLYIVENERAPSYLRSQTDVLDKTVSILLAEALTKHQASKALNIVKRVLDNSRMIDSPIDLDHC